MERGADCLVIFDFDWSLINENSDTWVFERLCPDLSDDIRQLSKDIYKGRWTELMDHMVGRMMDPPYNVSMADLNAALCSVPVFAEVLDALRLAKDAGCTIAILSDANEHYIDTIVEHLGIKELITYIVTNKSKSCPLDGSRCPCDACGEEGRRVARLHISPYNPPSDPHSCTLCPVNLCKGSVLDRWRRDGDDCFPRRVVYIGDGAGDYCPVTRLTSLDVALCRDGWSLHKSIINRKGGHDIAAKVVPWSTGADILSEFRLLFEN